VGWQERHAVSGQRPYHRELRSLAIHASRARVIYTIRDSHFPERIRTYPRLTTSDLERTSCCAPRGSITDSPNNNVRSQRAQTPESIA
jgi:hypothetical protein